MSFRRLVLACVVVSAWLLSAPAEAQFFRNNGIGVQVGWKGLGSTIDGLTGQKIWNMSDQATVGMGYYQALGYRWWFDILQAEIGMGAERIAPPGRDIAPIFSFSATTGVRYIFLEERLRPFVGAHVQYLQILPVAADSDIPNNALTGNAPFWVGLRVGGGVEYFVVDDVSLLAGLHLAGFAGLNDPPKDGLQTFVLPQVSGGLNVNIYF